MYVPVNLFITNSTSFEKIFVKKMNDLVKHSEIY